MNNNTIDYFKRKDHYSVEDLQNGIFLFRRGMFSNIFIVTADGVIATDPISCETALFYKKAILEITDTPVKYLIYSHDHTDHIAGGKIFTDTAKIISHVAAKDILIKRGNPDIILPDIIFKDKYMLTLGGKKIELIHFGPGSSPSSIAIYLRVEKILMMVDYVGANSVPYQDFPDVDIRGFIYTLKQIEKLDFDKIIYGHGPVGCKAHVTNLIQYMKDMIGETKKASLEVSYQKVAEEVGWNIANANPPFVLNKTFDRIEKTVIKRLRSRYGKMYGFEEWGPLNVRRIIHFCSMES